MEVDVGFPRQGEIMTLGGLGFKTKCSEAGQLEHGEESDYHFG